MLLTLWLVGAAVELLYGHSLHATLALVNATLLAYAILMFIGFPNFGALDFGLAHFRAERTSRDRSSLSTSSWLGTRRT